MTTSEPIPHEDAAPVPEPEDVTDTGALAAEQIAILRNLIVEACPDAVPELIQGADAAALLASIPTARAAFARIVQAAASPSPAGVPAAPAPAVVPAPVPAGHATRSYHPDPTTLSPFAKIRHGLTRE